MRKSWSGNKCALHKSERIKLAMLPSNEYIKMPVSGCCVHQLWAVINSWPPLLSLMPSEEEGEHLCPLQSKTYIIRLTKHRGSSCSRNDGKYIGMSQCRIRTKNVIHGNLSNVHVGMCWMSTWVDLQQHVKMIYINVNSCPENKCDLQIYSPEIMDNAHRSRHNL